MANHKENKPTKQMLEERIKTIRELTKIQTSDGNWNYNEYMQGMANGMILCLAIMEDIEPEFLETPENWVEGEG